MRHRHQTPSLLLQLRGRGIPPTASEHPPFIYSTVGGPSRAGPANGALGYLALFLYGSSAIFASAAVLFRYVRGAEWVVGWTSSSLQQSFTLR